MTPETLDTIISLNTPLAESLGFTSDKFDGWLWQKNHTIIISFIISKQEGKGNFTNLLNTIKQKGFNIQVPTPSNRMLSILKKRGFKLKREYDPNFKAMVELWES